MPAALALASVLAEATTARSGRDDDQVAASRSIRANTARPDPRPMVMPGSIRVRAAATAAALAGSLRNPVIRGTPRQPVVPASATWAPEPSCSFQRRMAGHSCSMPRTDRLAVPRNRCLAASGGRPRKQAVRMRSWWPWENSRARPPDMVSSASSGRARSAAASTVSPPGQPSRNRSHPGRVARISGVVMPSYSP